MTYEKRLDIVQQRFNEAKESREQHISQAAIDLEEMNRLQGEYRLLQELIKEAGEPSPVEGEL